MIADKNDKETLKSVGQFAALAPERAILLAAVRATVQRRKWKLQIELGEEK